MLVVAMFLVYFWIWKGKLSISTVMTIYDEKSFGENECSCSNCLFWITTLEAKITSLNDGLMRPLTVERFPSSSLFSPLS